MIKLKTMTIYAFIIMITILISFISNKYLFHTIPSDTHYHPELICQKLVLETIEIS